MLCLLVLQAAASDGWGDETIAGSCWGPDPAIGSSWQTEGGQANVEIKRGIKEATIEEHMQTVRPPPPSSSKASYSAITAACWHMSAAPIMHANVYT